MSNPATIKSRTSSITNAFVSGIIPVIKPTSDEIKQALDILQMDENSVVCAYCGDPCSEWDHFRPLIVDKKPTGYISEIHNLVPSCGKCNQSKGNTYWKEWITGSAPQSPKTRGVPDLEKRIELLEKYEETFSPRVMDFESVVGSDLWNKHWENCKKLHSMINESQELSDRIKRIIKQSI